MFKQVINTQARRHEANLSQLKNSKGGVIMFNKSIAISALLVLSGFAAAGAVSPKGPKACLKGQVLVKEAKVCVPESRLQPLEKVVIKEAEPLKGFRSEDLIQCPTRTGNVFFQGKQALGYTCDGVNGAPGATGENGFNSLITAENNPQCSGNSGGFLLNFGLDKNRNNTLDAEEVMTKFPFCVPVTQQVNNYTTNNYITNTTITGSYNSYGSGGVAPTPQKPFYKCPPFPGYKLLGVYHVESQMAVYELHMYDIGAEDVPVISLNSDVDPNDRSANRAQNDYHKVDGSFVRVYRGLKNGDLVPIHFRKVGNRLIPESTQGGVTITKIQ